MRQLWQVEHQQLQGDAGQPHDDQGCQCADQGKGAAHHSCQGKDVHQPLEPGSFPDHQHGDHDHAREVRDAHVAKQ